MISATPHLIISLFLVTSLILNSGNFNVATAMQLPTTLAPKSYKQVQTLFADLDYHWDKIDNGIPDISLRTLPQDLSSINDTKQKKQLFFMSLLPMVIKKNNVILSQRETIIQLLQKFDRYGSLNAQQQKTLKRLGKHYRCAVAPLNDVKIRQNLLRRIDIVPAALVIAQAANESAYGTSRFARMANNLFGEWTFKTGTGLVPLARSKDKTHEIKIFDSIGESIDSYLTNINTHKAYKKLRLAREKMRLNNQPIRANILAEGLINYSSRRGEYVREIQTMINYNRLAKLSTLELRDSTTQLVASAPTQALPTLHIAELSSRNRNKQKLALL
jgi:Bax protein